MRGDEAAEGKDPGTDPERKTDAAMRRLRRVLSPSVLHEAWDLLVGPHPVTAWWRNHFSAESVTGAAPVVVSMATYGDRLRLAHLALECIGRGTVRPQRLILHTRESVAPADLTPQLRRLIGRGLEVRHSPDYGPHVKYWSYVASVPAPAHHRLPLVTADDDALYGRDWLAGLMRAHDEYPNDVLAYRAHEVALADGRILPYAEWSAHDERDAGPRVFPTGRSGVLYPPRFLDALRDAGTAFLDCAPWADDVWLHAMELRTGTRARQIGVKGENFPVVPGTLLDGLSTRNVLHGGNDEMWADQQGGLR